MKLAKKSSLKFLVIIVTIVTVAVWLYYQNRLSAPSSNDNQPQSFAITDGQSLDEISSNLKNQGLIKDSGIFKIYIRLSGLSTKLQAGSYQIIKNESAKAIAKKLTQGFTDVWITVPEGLRSEEIAEKLSKELGINQKEFLQNSKEGYMFPDTYRLPQNISASETAKIMKDNFNSRFDKALQEQLNKSGLILDQAIILASLVEREVRFTEDRPIVAGILLSRLSLGMAFDVDATVQYALGYDSEEKTYWQKNLTDAEININSPYNTRRFAGYPPGPICSPGIAAIKAVLSAKRSDYLYYLSDPKGKMYYAKTLDEHNANKKYL